MSTKVVWAPQRPVNASPCRRLLRKGVDFSRVRIPRSIAVSAERGQFVIVVSSKALGMTGLNHSGNRSGSADSMASRRLSPS